MSKFNQQLIQARQQQRRRRILLTSIALLIIVILAIILMVSQGARIKVSPEEAAQQATIHVEKGWAILIADQLYSLSARAQLSVSAPGFKTATSAIKRDDFGKISTITLQPLPAELNLSTAIENSRTRWLIDGQEVSIGTRLTHSLDAGKHTVRVEHPYFEPFMRDYQLERGQTVNEQLILTPLLGHAQLDTVPQGATIRINGEERGLSPLSLNLSGGHYTVDVQHADFDTIHDTIDIHVDNANVERRYFFQPPLLTDDNPLPSSPKPTAPVTQENIANNITPPAVSADKAILEPPSTGKTPSDSLAPPPTYRTSAGGEMVLFTPNDTIVMRAKRSEPGQRANEFIRHVTINKAFYAGRHEVTNGEYAQFKPDHQGDAKHPVTHISWLDAVRYANWLSQQENLPPVYVVEGNKVVSVHQQTGYRLLTEAEWEWLARKAGRTTQTRFVWGDDTTIPTKAANIADESAKGKADQYVPRYTDGYAEIAPVMSMQRELSGLYDMGGNVSEWTHDGYRLLVPKQDAHYVQTVSDDVTAPHVIKGASWRSGSLTTLRATYREGGAEARADVGFRLGRFVTKGE